MDTDKSLEIIQALSNGVDPHTGDKYPAESPYQNPETVRALFMAIQALERAKKYEDRLRKLPGNAGKAWVDEEDQRLIFAFDAGKSIMEIAEKHQRTEFAINARLTKHGKIQL